MATAVTIGTVPLEEIHNLSWPTDRHLVDSFRKTLQYGGHFAPMHLNRVWQPEATWRYEIIDGFHRYEAAKAEGIPTLLCQVVEIQAREARYARIQACVGKPAEITRERALRELRLAFVSDMHAVIGDPEVLYEPILGEDGQVHARPRTAPVPDEPLAALEALTDHLLATNTEAPPYPVQRGQRLVNRTPFGLRSGWEQLLNDWLAEMGERFGYDASWLLQELHLQLLQEQGLGQGWTPRQREAFQRQGGYAFYALWLWNIPDVELRAWLRRQLQADPGGGEWLWKAMNLLSAQMTPQAGKPFQTVPKSVIVTLLNRYPAPRDLYHAVRDRQGQPSLEPLRALPPPVAAPPPPSSAPASVLPAPAPGEQGPASSIFAVGSRTFVGGDRSSPDQPKPAALPEPSRPDPGIAYQPVHAACMALLNAIHDLTAQYGQEWLSWEQAQADLAQLRAVVTPKDAL
jgi:hypothetical protein